MVDANVRHPPARIQVSAALGSAERGRQQKRCLERERQRGAIHCIVFGGARASGTDACTSGGVLGSGISLFFY